MKKNVHFILLFTFIISILVACNKSAQTSGDEQLIEEYEQPIKVMDEAHIASLSEEFKQIHERGILKVAMYVEDRFPYFFVNETGELVGSDVEMAYDIARQLGVEEVEFDRTAQTYDEIIDKVVAKEVDMAISKISITSNRAQRILFSEAYVRLKQAVLLNRMQLSQLRANQPLDVETLQLLKTNKFDVGVVAGTSYVEFAREIFPLATIVPFETKEAMLEAINAGEILAAFYDEFEFKRHINENPDSSLDLQLIVLDGRNDFLAIAIPADHLHMRAWLKHYLDYREPLEVDQILQQYSTLPAMSDE